MIPKINQRILTIISKTGLSNNGFAEAISTSSAVISHISTGRNKPNVEFVLKLVKKYTNVNLSWLLLGEGSMLIDPSLKIDDVPQTVKPPEKDPSPPEKPPEENVTIDSPPEGNPTIEEIAILNEVISSQRKAIESLEQTLKAHGKLVDFLKRKNKK